jgi:phage terminase large subunit-like protein
MDPTTTIEDSPAGFAEFYRMLFRRDLPLHAFAWVRRLYAARAEGKGFVIEAFRGSSKTTSISVAFLAFRIGLSPQDSFLVIQATAAAARATCRQVADLIANNPGWHIAFPHVVQDKEGGWSMAHGYEVKRDDMDYSQWRQLCAETKGRDPSFIGLGYRSSFIVGLHPTGMLLADDIHNENNTRSIKEMDKAVAIITSNILPTLNPKSWVVFIGTPWRQGDVLQYLKATETYESVSTPIYTESDEPHSTEPGSPLPDSSLRGAAFEPLRGESGRSNLESSALNHSDSVVPPHNSVISSEGALPLFKEAARRETPITPIEESPPPDPDQPISSDIARGTSEQSSNLKLSTLNIELTWPERFPIDVIQNYRQMLGEREFARMYLLDLTAAEGINLKAEWLQKVDSSLIQPSWPVVMGVDYASTADKQRDNDRDYFAVAIGRAQPSGSGIILIDGFRDHLSHAEAQDKLLELVAFYPNTEVIGIESVGKGEEFYQSLSSHPSLPIVSMNPGGEGKGPRFQKVLGPLFERGWARISNIESPFMQAFRREWLRWPWGDHDDTLDATYWMLRAGQSHLYPSSGKPKITSPFSDFGRT